MHSSPSIDLAKDKSTLSDDILKWALGFGRFLIIVVEIVAFSAFIYRFVLDRELVDLNDKIKAEQAIVKSLKDRETEYRNLQERLAIIKTVSKSSNSTVTLFNDLIKLTPPEITYDNFSTENNELKLTINIASIPALTKYINSLQEYDQIESVTVTKIDNSSGTNTVSVSFVAKLKGEKK